MTQTSTINSATSVPIAVGLSNASDNRYPATEAQLEVWLSSQQSVEANCAYNEISSLEFRGSLDVDRLKQALEKVVERHASLRSTFSEDGLHVIVRDSATHEFEVRDFTGDQSAEGRGGVDEAVRSVVHELATTPFELAGGSLLRVILQKLASDHFKLTFSAHHLILDGWSFAVFCSDLGHFYDVLGRVDREELPVADDYRQYAEKMQNYPTTDAGKADEAFWLKQFRSGDQLDIPVLDLPVENPRPALRTYEGRRYDHSISAELAEKIRMVGAKQGCSLFNTVLAAFNAYLARISETYDFCVGIPTAGQAAMDMPELIGHCVNTMPLRTQIDPAHSFIIYMKTCRNSLLDAFDHQRYSFGTLLRKLSPPRDPARPPMLSVSFNLDPMIDASKIGFSGLQVTPLIEPRSFENFEWFVNGVIMADKSIELQLQYNSNLYSKQSVRFYLEGFEAFLSQLAESPHTSIAEVNLMSVPQRQQVIVDWNESSLDYPTAGTLHGEFSRQAAATPDKIAARFEQDTLTYAEVETRSNQIARHLQSQGVGAGDLVGICVDRSERMLVYLYGILKSGAGYVPLDPAYPTDRLQYMCDHSGLKLIVTEKELNDRVAQFNKPHIAIDDLKSQIDQLDSGTVKSEVAPEDTCYVIYTSGSTGKPKGVQVPHGPVVNFLYSMQQTPGFGPDDSVLAVTTLSFDIAVLELYLPTVSGGTVVIVDRTTAVDGVKLAEELENHNISLMQATPATWRLMVQADWKGKPDLKVLCGGEPMPQDLVQPLLDRCGELWNMYGPTETTVWSAAYRIESATAPILIGKPIGNTQIYLLDKNGQEVPVGCEGELFIGGAGVTSGYLHQPEMTEERFVANRYRNPFVDYVSDRLYKTGDVARYRFDGNIQFLRRNDKQVKVRGFRIELGEIEQAIKSHPSVAQNVVIVREDVVGDARLVAYVVASQGQSVTATQLRDHVRESLPFYMVPQHFVDLDAMPQTNNGKIDYKALPAPAAEIVEEKVAQEIAMPNTPAEKFLAGVWQDVLEIDDVALNDLFFDVGGHSLLVMKVIATVKDKTNVKLGPQDFLVATLEQMADKLSGAQCFESEQQAPSVDAPAETESKPSSEAIAKPLETVDQVADTQSNGLFKTLKGFWD
jgi:amino acid adenylation domain-containing protein